MVSHGAVWSEARSRPLSQEPLVIGTKIVNVRQHVAQVSGGQTKPLGQCSRVLCGGCGRNPAAIGSGILWSSQCQGRKCSIDLAPLHSPAENVVVAAPRVIRSGARIRLQSTGEVGAGKGGHRV